LTLINVFDAFCVCNTDDEDSENERDPKQIIKVKHEKDFDHMLFERDLLIDIAFHIVYLLLYRHSFSQRNLRTVVRLSLVHFLKFTKRIICKHAEPSNSQLTACDTCHIYRQVATARVKLLLKRIIKLAATRQASVVPFGRSMH
jgi:hypothetical protein